MIKKILLLVCIAFSSTVMVAQTTVTGTVKDALTGDLLPGANIKIANKAVGTTTDFDGEFVLKVSDKPPFTIEISVIGFKTQEVEITKNNQKVVVALTENETSLDEIVVSASRTPERIMESPVTIERMDSRAIKNNTSPSFYDALENLKGVDINTSSLTFKSVNTRGFASFANERFVQLVDGMDNSSPALNFALGNLLGMSELDVNTVEILPGAASALYGANAFNGIMLMTSKSPFDSQGISFSYKQGITSSNNAGDNNFYDANIRMAYAFNDKFAAKATLSFLKGEEWHASDDRNTNGIGNTFISGDRDSDLAYDGVNVYGDEVKQNMRDVARALVRAGVLPASLASAINTHIPEDVEVSRTGYDERDLMSYDAKSVKFGGSLNYRPWGNDKLEIIWNSKFGTGNTIYQGQNRYNIANFFMEQHKLEVKGKNFFVRGYHTAEDAGDSYDTRFAAININRQWKDDATWFGEYVGTYFQSVLTNGLNNNQAHALARQVAENGRFIPGTPEFINAFNKVTADSDVRTGAKFKDNTNLYHVDANLNLQDYIDWAEIQVGGSYREFNLNSFGTIYTDGSGPINYNEYGVYSQLQKNFLEDDRLKFTASARYDKAQNFNGNVSPRVSLAYAMGDTKNHNFRASFQTGFRNPTTQDQYIGLNTGASYLIGTAEENLDRFVSAAEVANLDGNSYTLTGRDIANNSFSLSSVEDYLDGNLASPEAVNFDLVKPEKVTSYEVGYRGVIPTGSNKLGVDLSVYYNDYEDFISIKNVATPLYGDNSNANAINARDYIEVGFRTNSTADVSSYGLGLGLNTKILSSFNNGFVVGVNYTLSRFEFDQASDPDFEAAFNTPEHKVKFQVGHPNLFKNFGFNFNARWQNEYYWQSTFLEGEVAARTILDAQINYKLPKLKSVIKVGGSNLTGQQYLSAPGGGIVGSQYFVSLTINN